MEVETHKTLSSSFNLQSKPPFSFPLNGIIRSDLHPPESPISAISDSASAGTRETNFSDFSSGKSSLKVDMVACDDAVPAVDEKVNGCRSPVMDGNSESSAVLRMQKVYRGYRTRRKLADSAVVAEELWWQAIDYARLNHSTISFFNFSKPESASSRWNRIVSNASKVGKGLSKDVNAQKLAFQHWIEAIDPRHRYGHSLHFYYEEWCKTDAGQPFFYWLDVGEGKDLNLKECPRSKLRQQCIKYLGPQERENYEYVFEEGKVIHQQTGTLLDTNKGVKMIFVMSTSKKLYAGEKKKGLFHHSSFLAGGATLAAGRLEAANGVLKSISPYSGHYRPSDDSLDIFLSVLKEYGVNLDEVQVNKASEDSEIYDDGKPTGGDLKVEVPTISKAIELLISGQEKKSQTSELPETVQIQTKNSYQRQLSGGLRSPKADVPKTAILQRINSKKAAKSYQLGHQLSLKWTTGAGPRIGCVADYPIEVRKQALEFVSLSPRLPTTPSAFRLAPQSGLASPSADATSSA